MGLMVNFPTEYEEQCNFVAWLEAKKLKFTAIPNSTFTTSWGQKIKNKKLGLRAGLPDLLIITPLGLVFVEMKRLKGGSLKPDQKEWIEALNELSGVEAKMCRGAEEAINYIKEFIPNNIQ